VTPGRRQQLAKGLAKNELLPEYFREYADELREQWEQTKLDEAETRETVFLQLHTLDELRDFLNARIANDVGDGDK
tara:strand:+ start:257 stop:484 length:228 start_codon:yes stop_codon:yes gene_type:complete